ERGLRGRRRHAAKELARLRRARLLHARYLGPAPALVQGGLRLGRHPRLRHVQRADLVLPHSTFTVRTASGADAPELFFAMTRPMLLRYLVCTLACTLASCAAPSKKTD